MRAALLQTAALFTVLVTGCSDSARSTKTQTTTTTSNGDTAIKERARQERREAVDATADELRVERDIYARKLEDGLAKLDTKMEELGQRIERATGDTKARLQKEWDELEPQRKAANERLDELKKSSSAAWQDVKAGAQSAFDELRDSVNRASTRFEEDEKK